MNYNIVIKHNKRIIVSFRYRLTNTMHILNNYIPKELAIIPVTPIKHLYGIQHYVYILEIVLPTMILYKVGLSKDVGKRVKSLSNVEKPSSDVRGMGVILNSIDIIATASLATILDASIYENYLMNKYKHYKYTGTPVLPNANSELFTTNILLEIQSGR